MLTHLKFKSNFCDDPFLGFLLGKVPTVFSALDHSLPQTLPRGIHPPGHSVALAVPSRPLTSALLSSPPL